MSGGGQQWPQLEQALANAEQARDKPRTREQAPNKWEGAVCSLQEILNNYLARSLTRFLVLLTFC